MKDGYVLTTPRAGSTPLAIVLSRALVAGFLASVAMVVAFSIAFVVALVLGNAPLGPLSEWSRGLTSNALIDMAKPSLYTALGVFFTGGLLWAVLYALVAEPRLSGPSWRQGVVFAIVPWLFSLLVFLPLVGGGFLGMSLGAGPLPIVGNAILHLVYGAALGFVYGPLGDSVLDDPGHAAAGDDVQSGPSSEVGAARGLLIGLVVGVVVGVLAVAALQNTQVLHLNPLSIVVPTALIAAAFGGLIGSLSA
ncbi:MAG TPA: DUF6789 family protein [Chloroflexota bacterium]|jgi:hypothetical protein|nr:DUF6789 family protein [Chloroflexota bacterium]